MANSSIQLPVEGSGPRLDTELLTVDGQSVHRERDQIAGADAAAIMEVLSVDPAEDDYGAVVRIAPPMSPAYGHGSTTVTAGSSDVIDMPAIASGKTAKLAVITVAASMACKFELQKRDGGLVVTFAVVFVGGLVSNPNHAYRPFHKSVVTLPYGNGDENWRVRVTNLDQNAGDAYVTVEWDEV